MTEADSRHLHYKKDIAACCNILFFVMKRESNWKDSPNTWSAREAGTPNITLLLTMKISGVIKILFTSHAVLKQRNDW